MSELELVENKRNKIKESKELIREKVLSIIDDKLIETIGEAYEKLTLKRYQELHSEHYKLVDSLVSIFEMYVPKHLINREYYAITKGDLSKVGSLIDEAISKKTGTPEKRLVYSMPDEDHHYTYIVESKDLCHVKNMLQVDNDFFNFELASLSDSFITKIIYYANAGLGLIDVSEDNFYEEYSQEDHLKWVNNYFIDLIENPEISTYEFSVNLLEILNTGRGSWSSSIWV